MRLIDADYFLERLAVAPLIQEAMRKAFNQMPTIELVRCKNCVYSCPFNEEELKDPFRVGEWDCKFWCAEVHEDDYCSRGKRRKDAKRNNS